MSFDTSISLQSSAVVRRPSRRTTNEDAEPLVSRSCLQLCGTPNIRRVSQEALESVIEDRYPGANLDVHHELPHGRLTGSIVCEGFEGMAQDAREVEMWKWLWGAFGFNATTIGRLNPMTPTEYDGQAR